MYKNIHKIIVKNLLFGVLVIIILTFSIIAIIEHNRLDKFTRDLAIKESKKYSEDYEDYYKKKSNQKLNDLKEAISKNLDHSQFILIELYDESKNKIVVDSLNRIIPVNGELEKSFHDFKMSSEIEHIKKIFSGELYIKIMVPIFQKNSNVIIGNFEGIYHVSNDSLEKIEKQIIYLLVQSFIVIFFTTLLLYPVIFMLNKKLMKNSNELLESNINTLKSLGSAIAKRDSDTNAHNYRVTIFAIKFAEKLKISKSQIQSLIKGSFLHDIGKIGISDSILLKPGKLTDEEFDIMKQHVILGVDIIKNNKWLVDAKDVVLSHHEKFNGKGYMASLNDKEIPVNARIFAIIDVFDALTSKRPYKNPFPLEESLEILREGSGTHFDPVLLKDFEEIAKTLYGEISGQENEPLLNKILDLHVNKYFSM